MRKRSILKITKHYGFFRAANTVGIILMAIDTLIEGGDKLTAEQQKTVKGMILDSALRLNDEVNTMIRRAKGVQRD
jgi:hypothetical protein